MARESFSSSNGTLRSRMSSILRHLLFAAIVASMVGLYTAVVGPSLGKFRLVSTTRLLLPLMTISALVALPTYAALRRDARRSAQVVNLYGAFVLTCLLYGAFGWVSAPDGSSVFLVTALLAGHILGLPLFLLLVVVHFVLEHIGFYRREP